VTGLMICDDLIFTSRVTATARAKGLTVTPVRSADDAIRRARDASLACVIVDLHTAGGDLPALLTGLREACPAMPRVVAYGSHVNKELLQAARDAGCDLVMPRSKFANGLETELANWFRPADRSEAGLSSPD
jgi:DNA-binding NarL/FixJ family response regulator